jgi:ubiquinone/menaquinone biosynthesis C-methylase UbiE/uncharacterized protein YbaR (Trm112 family)
MNKMQQVNLICPDCLAILHLLDNHDTGFVCKECKLIFPTVNGIYVLLAKQERNYTLEYPIMLKIKEDLRDSQYLSYAENTLNLLESNKGVLTWDWEDEKYWAKHYGIERTGKTKKNWNDRLWQREKLIKNLTSRVLLDGASILDIGCGEGQNFRELIHGNCSSNCQYIAIDISFSALKINQLRNPHNKSCYILCSEDYELPLSSKSIDVICYFGILHHTRNKTKNIAKDSRLLKANGYIILCENIDRPILKNKRGENSPHDGHLSKENLFLILSKSNSQILYVKEESTPFYTLCMILFSETIKNNKHVFYVISEIDHLIGKTFGKVVPHFKPGEIQVLLRRNV